MKLIKLLPIIFARKLYNLACDCNNQGSASTQCNSIGNCSSKSNVLETKCMKCHAGFSIFQPVTVIIKDLHLQNATQMEPVLVNLMYLVKSAPIAN